MREQLANPDQNMNNLPKQNNQYERVQQKSPITPEMLAASTLPPGVNYANLLYAAQSQGTRILNFPLPGS